MRAVKGYHDPAHKLPAHVVIVGKTASDQFAVSVSKTAYAFLSLVCQNKTKEPQRGIVQTRSSENRSFGKPRCMLAQYDHKS